jgi:hypothetical protein
LPAEAAHFRHGHASKTDGGERVFDGLHLVVPNDCFDFFHGSLALVVVRVATAARLIGGLANYAFVFKPKCIGSEGGEPT